MQWNGWESKSLSTSLSEGEGGGLNTFNFKPNEFAMPQLISSPTERPGEAFLMLVTTNIYTPGIPWSAFDIIGRGKKRCALAYSW